MDAKAWKEYVAKSLEDKLVPDETALMKWTKIVNNGRPVMAVADTLSEAASVMGVDAKGLEATVRDWNKMVKQGKDTAFGRQITGGIGEGRTTSSSRRSVIGRRSAACVRARPAHP